MQCVRVSEMFFAAKSNVFIGVLVELLSLTLYLQRTD